jgi:hypothetical protein
MKIPVFLSRPNTLKGQREEFVNFVTGKLKKSGLEPRTLGKSDYPTDTPIREVQALARHCAGGVILGLAQLHVKSGCWHPGDDGHEFEEKKVLVPTPWTQIEGALLFSLGKPLLIIREEGLKGGVFDDGAMGNFVHTVNLFEGGKEQKRKINDIFMKWQSQVRSTYYGPSSKWSAP